MTNEIDEMKAAHALVEQPGKVKPTTFIVFCETNLRYEGGRKAVVFLGPYLLGCAALELVINSETNFAKWGYWSWTIFLAYLVLFPPFWKRILNSISKAGRSE